MKPNLHVRPAAAFVVCDCIARVMSTKVDAHQCRVTNGHGRNQVKKRSSFDVSQDRAGQAQETENPSSHHFNFLCRPKLIVIFIYLIVVTII